MTAHTKLAGKPKAPVARFEPAVGFSRGWIPWGMHHDLMDVGEPAITDINDWVSGYAVQGLLNSYTPTVTTVAALRNSILSNNGFRQQAEVEHIVIGYGWQIKKYSSRFNGPAIVTVA